ncbi:PHP domain-containing protein [Thermosulfurimonas dismutans]|uniref:Putative metal-dependent phosphoesterases (PHP family) n=1 Tax=Thermosulfurimonas dismutans TaxID=999894 RepID=A0A179D212_9BACT|nr:PHP domain-containing protein [Thermosulfurimonas dismutans]OAQ19831.1 putative metal-dependent phosphoesterases (PHP family) [Thermosulfurimonas dismutans]
MIDLHTHSTASDGTYSPAELVQLAKDVSLSALALTDHDTVEGLGEAMAAARELGVPFVPGVEISVKFDGPGHCHILGYFVDADSPVLRETLGLLQRAREERNRKMMEKLQSLGVDITLEELEDQAKGEIGRPHFAALLVKKGVVKSVGEAFEKYLKKGAPAYVPKARLTAEEAFSAIRAAGGLAVLAHPIHLKLSPEELVRYVEELKAFGLDGIEAYYTDHTKQFTTLCLEIARRYDLVPTGGSDFHGHNKPDIKLGRGFGNLSVPDECYERLRRRWEAKS